MEDEPSPQSSPQALPRSPTQQAEADTESPSGEGGGEEDDDEAQAKRDPAGGMPTASTSSGRGTGAWGQTDAPPARGQLLKTVRDEYAERYGISLDELEKRQDIPLHERTALNRGEFVRLQQLSRRRLAATLTEQTAARMPLYR